MQRDLCVLFVNQIKKEKKTNQAAPERKLLLAVVGRGVVVGVMSHVATGETSWASTDHANEFRSLIIGWLTNLTTRHRNKDPHSLRYDDHLPVKTFSPEPL